MKPYLSTSLTMSDVFVELWGKPPGKQQKHPVEQVREQNLQDSIGRVTGVMKSRVSDDEKRKFIQMMLATEHEE
eukprot:2131591-Rhodomonas_salina.1